MHANVKCQWPILLLFLVLVSSCKKQYIDVIQVVEKTKDLSVAGLGTVNNLLVINGNHLIASDGKQIFTSDNQGTNWVKMNLPPIDSIKQMEFRNLDTGFIIQYNAAFNEDYIYTTSNRGLTWKAVAQAHAGGYVNNDLYFIFYHYTGKFNVFKSANNGANFSQQPSITAPAYPGTSIFFAHHDSIILVGNSSGSQYQIFRVNIMSGDVNILGEMWGIPNIIHFWNEDIHLLGSPYQESMFENDYALTGMDHYGDFGVIVGENSIYTNQKIQTDEDWNEVYDAKGSNYRQNFQQIKLINPQEGFITGENGLIWKIKFYY